MDHTVPVAHEEMVPGSCSEAACFAKAGELVAAELAHSFGHELTKILFSRLLK